MSYRDKQDLLALIDSLSKRQGATQYDEGKLIIDERGIRILKQYIKNMEE